MFEVSGLVRKLLHILALLVVFFSANLSQTEAAIILEELATNPRVISVTNRVQVNGQLETSTTANKAIALKLDVNAEQQYLERRLPGNGRNAEALRSVRSYDTAEAKIIVSQQTTFSRVREQMNLIVAQGTQEGIEFYSPTGNMTFSELDVLSSPADSLAILGLLPTSPVEVGKSWEPSGWVIQMLTGIEAVIKSELSCKLVSATAETAKIEFEGKIEGATQGASTEISLSGTFTFDLKQKLISELELTQTEKRSVGAVSPGMQITAIVKLTRSVSEKPGPLTEEFAANIPLETPPGSYLLLFQSPWNVRFGYGRNWHIFHQSAAVSVLRLIDKGSFIAQCNISKIANVSPGQHTPEPQFQADIRKALGEKLAKITKAEQIKTNDGRFLYRVTTVGKSNGIEMTWIYYLCAAPDGRQLSFVFSVETKLIEQLGNQDLGIIQGLEFLAAGRAPTKAASKDN